MWQKAWMSLNDSASIMMDAIFHDYHMDHFQQIKFQSWKSFSKTDQKRGFNLVLCLLWRQLQTRGDLGSKQ